MVQHTRAQTGLSHGFQQDFHLLGDKQLGRATEEKGKVIRSKNESDWGSSLLPGQQRSSFNDQPRKVGDGGS